MKYQECFVEFERVIECPGGVEGPCLCLQFHNLDPNRSQVEVIEGQFLLLHPKRKKRHRALRIFHRFLKAAGTSPSKKWVWEQFHGQTMIVTILDKTYNGRRLLRITDYIRP
jgi:hypothetical protein